MALVIKDRIQETTTTTGTGTLTLGGAVAGFQSFSVIGNGNTTYYAIVYGTDFEVGIGTYTSSGTTLSRDTILSSSNSNNAVNFGSGTKNVFVTYPASKSVNLNSGNSLDLTGVPIVTSSNGNITLTPNGSGYVAIGNYFSNYNAVTVDMTISIDSSQNAFLIGPITVNSGITWTIASGSTLALVTLAL